MDRGYHRHIPLRGHCYYETLARQCCADKLRLGQYRGGMRGGSDILGRDNFYVEVMDHGLPIEKRVRTC